MKKALVTGGAGFVGSYLCDELVGRGVEVVAVDDLSRGRSTNLDSAISSEQCRLEVLDLCENEAAGILRTMIAEFRPDVIFHLAAINGTKYFYDRPTAVLRQNVRMVETVCDSATAAQFNGTIVFTSSSEVYGDPDIVPTPEHSPVVIRPLFDRDSYALSKVVGEMEIRLSAETQGWSYSIARLFNSYGPRMDSSEYGQVVPEFIRKVSSPDQFELIGTGDQTRSFCYVEDTAYLLAECPAKFLNSVVNIGNDTEVSIGDLAAMVHRLVDREPDIKHLPASVGDHKRRCPDVSFQTRVVGEREFVSLEEGLKRCIEWYLPK